jgi:predicted naringenin-chalcone synthase
LTGLVQPVVEAAEFPITEAPWPRLLGLGTATPPLCLSQAAVAQRLADLWSLRGSDLERWQRIIVGSEISTRYGVLPIEQVLRLSTEARMALYERSAPELAEAAAGRALRRSGIDPGRVTDLIVVSCTGFSAPGVDIALVDRLGLRPTVRRTVVGFMGCFGAIIGLRTAVGACRADPHAVALVLCLELCSLHLRSDRSAQNQVASALFADGAAAAVVVGAEAVDGVGTAMSVGGVTLGYSRLIPEGRDWMSWRITDAGFAMTLTRDVPLALREHVAAIVNEASPQRPCFFVVHPGGAGILDAVEEGLGLRGGSGLDASRDILRRFGNMSSVTVLFVLDEALRRGYRPPALLLAFGPGLSVECLSVLPVSTRFVG